jgi:hypothetical protein
MTARRTPALVAALALVTSGCAAMHHHPVACQIAARLTGATLGAVGGGLGTDQIGEDPTNGEVAGGAAAGFVVGAARRR